MSENSQTAKAATVKDPAGCRWLEKILQNCWRRAEQLQAGRSSQAPVLSQAAEAWTEEATEVSQILDHYREAQNQAQHNRH